MFEQERKPSSEKDSTGSRPSNLELLARLVEEESFPRAAGGGLPILRRTAPPPAGRFRFVLPLAGTAALVAASLLLLVYLLSSEPAAERSGSVAEKPAIESPPVGAGSAGPDEGLEHFYLGVLDSIVLTQQLTLDLALELAAAYEELGRSEDQYAVHLLLQVFEYAAQWRGVGGPGVGGPPPEDPVHAIRRTAQKYGIGDVKDLTIAVGLLLAKATEELDRLEKSRSVLAQLEAAVTASGDRQQEIYAGDLARLDLECGRTSLLRYLDRKAPDSLEEAIERLSEAASRIEKGSLDQPTRCRGCDGTGRVENEGVRRCDGCRGTGKVQRIVELVGGKRRVETLCRRCGGRGVLESRDETCRECAGSGQAPGSQTTAEHFASFAALSHALLAQCHAHRGDRARAEAELSGAAARSDDRRVELARADAWRLLGEPEKAAQLYLDLFTREPAIEPCGRAASLYLEARRYRAAEAVVVDGLSRFPESTRLRELLERIRSESASSTGVRKEEP